MRITRVIAQRKKELGKLLDRAAAELEQRGESRQFKRLMLRATQLRGMVTLLEDIECIKAENRAIGFTANFDAET